MPSAQATNLLVRWAQDVHEPVSAPVHYTSLHAEILDSTRRTYAGMISAVDEVVHNVTSELKAGGMWEKTVLVISNDNGGSQITKRRLCAQSYIR